MTKGQVLRELIQSDEMLVLPGGVNALTAKLIEDAGFAAAYMTGYGASLNLLGLPDAGLATMTEVVMNAGYMANAISIPLLVDADTGYGNAVNIRRTVQAFAQAGVAGIHVEDQITPKRCGSISGRELISTEEMVGKIRAAVDARNEMGSDLVIVARSDALGGVGGGLENTLHRANAYLEAGADAFMIAEEALNSLELLQEINHKVNGPFVCQVTQIDPAIDHADLRAAGLSVALYPSEGWKFGMIQNARFLREFMAGGAGTLNQWNRDVAAEPLGAKDAMHEFAGFPEIFRVMEEYMPADGATDGAGWKPKVTQNT